MKKKTKKLFLTGGSGLFALNCALICKQSWDVYLGIHNRVITPPFAKTVSLVFQSLDELKVLLSDLQPDLVINAAALTNIEICEENPVDALNVNVILAERIALACSHFVSHLFIFLQTTFSMDYPPLLLSLVLLNL